MRRLNNPSAGFLGISLLASASLAFALIAQHAFNVPPGPWSILQRIVLLELILGGAIGAYILNDSRILQAIIAVILTIVSVIGMGLALLQILGSKEFKESCEPGFAEVALKALPLGDYLPSVFGIYTECLSKGGTAADSGLAYWALLLFLITALIGIAYSRVSFLLHRAERS